MGARVLLLVSLVFSFGLLGCGGSDASGVGAGAEGGVGDGSSSEGSTAEGGSGNDAGDAMPTGNPKASFPTTDIDFGNSGCGGAPAGQKTLKIQNAGDAPLTYSAAINPTTTFFLIGPMSGSIDPGKSATLTLSALAVPGSTVAGTELDATLTITTNDPALLSKDVKVKTTAAGATLALMPAMPNFGTVPLNTQATDIPLTLKNNGNAAVTINFTAPVDPQFDLVWTGSPMDVMLAPGASVPGLAARFRPSLTQVSTSTAPIVTMGALCGTNPTAIPLQGQGASGAFALQPASIDFGAVSCGTTSTLAANMRTVTITNSGNSAFTFTTALTRGGSSPYTLTVSSATVAANGGTQTIRVNPKAIPSSSAVTTNLYGDTLTITTNIPNDTPHTVDIAETASGAILAYQPATPIAFGNVPINTQSTANFVIVNNGNAPATITAAASNMSVYALSSTALGTLMAGDMAQETATFSPTVTGVQTSNVTLAAAGGDVLCAPLPSLRMSGTGTNGAIAISPASIDFLQVDCGTRAMARTITVRNTGSSAFTWAAALVVGTSYALQTTNLTLQPAGMAGDTGTVVVTPITIPAVSDVTPDLYADTLAITTNISGDVEHDIPLHMTAHGAILGVSTNDLTFGGVRINTTSTTQFSVNNTGNASAAVTVTNANGVFTFSPQGAAVAGSTGEVVTASFRPTMTQMYSDTGRLTVPNGTPLCGPLPNMINLSGTGTNGAAVVSPGSLDYGRVNCGTVASDQSITIQNNGTALFNYTATLTGGASYYGLNQTMGTVDPGNQANITVTPVPVPSTSLTTADLYAGQVTITTDVMGDSPHIVSLHETAQGARLTVNVTTLAFGNVTVGQNASLPFTITNGGNATSNIAYAGYMTPPFTAAPDLVPILGSSVLNVNVTFAPQSVGPVTGQSLTIQQSDVLCLPLPAAITFSGSGQ